LLPYSEIEIEGIPEPIGLWLFSEAAGVVYLKIIPHPTGSRECSFRQWLRERSVDVLWQQPIRRRSNIHRFRANSLRNFIGSTCENSPQILSADAGIVTVWSTGRVEQLRVASGTETVRFARAAASLSNSVGTISTSAAERISCLRTH
jgi:hypothetical protein